MTGCRGRCFLRFPQCGYSRHTCKNRSLDVNQYDAGHIPGALSIPIDQLKDQLSLIQEDKEIVAYCRGPYCVYAFKAVELLRSHGFTAFRIEAGVQEWNLFAEQTELI